ncbi:hypothetical protein TSOC_004735 [Tetrabaena socialis]|uniref:EF-hand domain-containing protein n=1 Tax=Tetrabaena socialis TaxID=47790 RepID=A0A2J8A852_9CHLO|nr:hypothetical protein TSOC_004735 [Tetrabaena socialis]|eukprot:PNH08704.1 hypothetical protein TSOC_004735 [Tetrabaena socialis]
MTEYIITTEEVPALDFGRLVAPAETAIEGGRAGKQDTEKASQREVARPGIPRRGKLRLARLARLDSDTKAKVSRSVQTSHVRSWLHLRGYVVKADKLHPAITRVIAQWFDLVDQDGSRTLEHSELLAALKTAHIPCDDATITELIELMDMNQDGVIGWDEFEVFMTQEFAAGKNLLSGEYLLPSGLAINFGVMIGKLKRNKLLSDVMKEGARRARWADIARDSGALGRELAVMQEAAEATNLTLEHIKRNETGDSGLATPRTQLTAALLREMEHDRRLARDRAFSGASFIEHGASRGYNDEPWGQDARQRGTALGVSPDPNAQGPPAAADGAHVPRGSALMDPLMLIAQSGYDAAGAGAGYAGGGGGGGGGGSGGSRSTSPGMALAHATVGTFSRCGTPMPPMLAAPPPPGLAVPPPEQRAAHGSASAAGAYSRSASRQGGHEEPPPDGGGGGRGSGGGGGPAALLGRQTTLQRASPAATGAGKHSTGTGTGAVAEWRRRTSLQCGSPASFDEMMSHGGGRAAAYRLLAASQSGDGSASGGGISRPHSDRPMAWRDHRHRSQRTMSTVGQIADGMRAAAAADAAAAALAAATVSAPQHNLNHQPHLRAIRHALYPTTVDGLPGPSPLVSPAGSSSEGVVPAGHPHQQSGSHHGGIDAAANAAASLPYAPQPVPYFVAPSYGGLMLPILTDHDQLADYIKSRAATMLAPTGAAAPAAHPTVRDAAALLSERKAVVRTASRRPSAGSASTASRAGTESAVAPEADGQQEWISYTRIPASTLGPTPVAAAHAHARARAGSPAPPLLPRDRGGGGPPSDLSCATELGATAAVISFAQAQAAAGYGSSWAVGGPSSSSASALRPSSSLAGTRSAFLSRDGLHSPGSHSPGSSFIRPALKGPHPAVPAAGRSSSHSAPDALSRGGPGGGHGGHDAQRAGGQPSRTDDVEDADAEVARLFGNAPSSSWRPSNNPDPFNRPETVLHPSRRELLLELGVRSESAPPGKMARAAAHAEKRPTGGGGGSGSGGGGASMRAVTGSSSDGSHGSVGGGGVASRSVRVGVLGGGAGLCVQGVAPTNAGSTSGGTASSLVVAAWSHDSPGPTFNPGLLGIRTGSWSSCELGPGGGLYSSAPPSSMTDADSCANDETLASTAGRAAHGEGQRLTGHGDMRRSESSSAQGSSSSSRRPGSRLAGAGGQRGASPARNGAELRTPGRCRSQLSWRNDKEVHRQAKLMRHQ